MFRLIKNLTRIKYESSNVVRLSSNFKARDEHLSEQFNENDYQNDYQNNEDKLSIENDFKLNKINEIKLRNKDDLAKFKENIQKLSLAECLDKYELSIKSALQLDPKLQKRILIKGLVTQRIIKSDKVRIRLIDTNTFEIITVFMPDYVFKNYTDKITRGSSIALTGLVFLNLKSNLNSFYCDKIIYANHSTFKYVNYLHKTEHTIMDWFRLRNYPAMKFRSIKFAAIIKLRSVLINQIHQLMSNEQFVHVTPPILTSWPTDDAFTITNSSREDYFYTNVYLSKESDKHLESIVNAIPQIYAITHSFTSDQTRSKQSANEQLNLEVCQLAANDKLDDLMNQVEYFIKKLSSSFLSLGLKALDEVNKAKHRHDCKLDRMDFNYLRLTYEEALEVLEKKDVRLKRGDQLTFYHKAILSKYFENYPIFIYNYPYAIKGDFDTQCIDEKAQRFELLIGKGLTACKGKIKSNASFSELADKLKELNYDEETVSWYLDLKKKGTVPCTWFALSIDCFLMTITDLPSLRDTILFPRMPNYCQL